jgi:hypothetical protein
VLKMESVMLYCGKGIYLGKIQRGEQNVKGKAEPTGQFLRYTGDITSMTGDFTSI